MALPILICGGGDNDRLSGLDLTPKPDLLVLDGKTSIKISQVRELQTWLQTKPYQSPEKTAVILHAEKLTLPAQHALLKTLEEPPANSRLVLLCPNENQLLPTLVSRCRLKKLKPVLLADADNLKQKQISDQLTQAKGAAKFNLVAPMAVNKDQAIGWIEQQLIYQREQMLKSPQKANPKLIHALNFALKCLKANVNPKLTLDVLSLNF